MRGSDHDHVPSRIALLLPAVLGAGWRRAQVERMRASVNGPPGGGDLGQELKARLGQAPGREQPVGRLPRIVYASRTHSRTIASARAGMHTQAGRKGQERTGTCAYVCGCPFYLCILRERKWHLIKRVVPIT